MKNVKVIIWGFGAMGSGIAKTLLNRKGIDIVGVGDIGAKVGKSMFEVLGVEKGDKEEVIIGDAMEIIKPGAADIVVVCTDSFTKGVFPKLKFVMEQGINVITSAEQMAYPAAQEPELAAEIDRIAKENGVSVLGTGINPGHIMDMLVLVMTGAMTDVEHIVSRRVNSLSPFGPTVMEEQGIGISIDEFKARKADGTMAGHVGFHESVGMMAEGLGWEIDKFEQDMEPIVTDVDRVAPYGEAKAGTCAGVAMVGNAYMNGECVIEMDHPQQIEPEQVGINTGDYVIIKGTPNINMVNSPEVEGGLGTIAMLVNMIPQVINADAGLHTMLSLPIPCCVLGDYRDKIKEDKKIVK
jgi:4-hydroxy-tetrahydrodipicolinate reductase